MIFLKDGLLKARGSKQGKIKKQFEENELHSGTSKGTRKERNEENSATE